MTGGAAPPAAARRHIGAEKDGIGRGVLCAYGLAPTVALPNTKTRWSETHAIEHGSSVRRADLWIFGIRLPVIMGCTFAAVGPMVAIGTNPALGILDIFGSTIAAGAIGIVLAPMIGRLLRFFPTVVVGC